MEFKIEFFFGRIRAGAGFILPVNFFYRQNKHVHVIYCQLSKQKDQNVIEGLSKISYLMYMSTWRSISVHTLNVERHSFTDELFRFYYCDSVTQ